MKYKEFRKKSPIPSFMCIPLASSICYPMSPFISMLCIKWKIRPNTITFLMIVFGILGGLVLMIPNAWCKIAAGLIYYIWYTLDLSDGEVARITQTFSKGGKYLDWCAHLVTHPLYAVAMWYSLALENNLFLITIVTFILIICEMLYRNWISMATLYGDIENSPYRQSRSLGIILFVFDCFLYLPNVIIATPILLGCSILFGWAWFCWVYLIWALLYSFVALRVFVRFIWKIYK